MSEWLTDWPVREQTELGVTSGVRGSSLTGWGRVCAWGPHGDTDTGSGSRGHNSTTDCSAQRRRPGWREEVEVEWDCPLQSGEINTQWVKKPTTKNSYFFLWKVWENMCLIIKNRCRVVSVMWNSPNITEICWHLQEPKKKIIIINITANTVTLQQR